MGANVWEPGPISEGAHDLDSSSRGQGAGLGLLLSHYYIAVGYSTRYQSRQGKENKNGDGRGPGFAFRPLFSGEGMVMLLC